MNKYGFVKLNHLTLIGAFTLTYNLPYKNAMF